MKLTISDGADKQPAKSPTKPCPRVPKSLGALCFALRTDPEDPLPVIVTFLEAESRRTGKAPLRLLEGWINEKAQSRQHPHGLTDILTFDDDWRNEYNTLLIDDADNLYLADAGDVPWENATRADLQPVSLVEAMEWYYRVEGRSTSSSGNVAELCRLAVEQLKK
jgi:hypothetical protein